MPAAELEQVRRRDRHPGDRQPLGVFDRGGEHGHPGDDAGLARPLDAERVERRRRLAGCADPANWVAAAAEASKAYRSGFESTATVDSGTDVAGAPTTCTTPSTISRSAGSTSRASEAIRRALARTFAAASPTALPLM